MKRTKSILDALMPRTRQAVLAATLLQPERSWYLRELARSLRILPSSLQRELAALDRAGVLTRRRDGNRVYYQADASFPLFSELKSILTKTVGLIDVLREHLRPLGGSVRWAFVYGSVARGEERSSSDVDLMVVGDAGLADLTPALRRAEERLSRPVNVNVYTAEEFRRKIGEHNHFLTAGGGGKKLGVMGGLHELAGLIDGEQGAAAHDEPAGA